MTYLKASIKFLIFFCATLGLYGSWYVLRVFIPNKVYWRQTAFELWAKMFVRLSGMKIEVSGEPPKPPFFLVSNHLSYVDIMALRAVVPGVFVAKSEINDWFIAGRLVRDMGNIFIDRKNRRDIPRAGEKIIRKLSGGEGVIVFPEGTSTKGEDVLPFNSSFLEFAARTDLPVSHVSISYLTPEGSPPASEMVCWWDDTTLLEHIFRLMRISEYTAILAFGEEPVLNADRKRLAAQLRERVKERFVPVI